MLCGCVLPETVIIPFFIKFIHKPGIPRADSLYVVCVECMWCILDKKSLPLRGIVVILFGLLAIVGTKFVLDFLVYLFGFFAILTGIMNAGVGISSEKTELPKWLLLITGVLGILLGIFALLTPLIIAMTITMFIAAWALITGISELGLAFAIILVLIPVLSAYALVIVLGIYALVFGFISIFLGFSMGRQQVVVETRTFL